MELTKKMMQSIEGRVSLDLINISDYEYQVSCLKNEKKNRVELRLLPDPYVSQREYIEAEKWLEKYKFDIKKYLDRATSLKWEETEECWYLKSGYVVFMEAFDNYCVEEYQVIEGIEIHSPVIYKDGKADRTHGTLDPYCQCPSCTWKPCLEDFDFALEMPEEEKEMNSLNSIILEGNLVRDPDFSHTPKGTLMCEFTIASHFFYKFEGNYEEEVSFFEVRAWAKVAKTCNHSLKKGRGVRIIGRLKQDRWKGSDGKEKSAVHIIADHLEFNPRYKIDYSKEMSIE